MLKLSNYSKSTSKPRAATKAESNSTTLPTNNSEALSTKATTIKETFKLEPKNKKNKKSKTTESNLNNKPMDNKNHNSSTSPHGNAKMESASIKKSSLSKVGMQNCEKP